MAGERSSSEADRKLESGTAKKVTENANSNPSDGGLHPAFYIAYAHYCPSPLAFVTCEHGMYG